MDFSLSLSLSLCGFMDLPLHYKQLPFYSLFLLV